MILGHGDIASVLAPVDIHPRRLYFASGVSHSGPLPESEYQREADLLDAQDHSLHLVYFSSLCVFYSHTRYAMHKRTMESNVIETFPRYTIMRLGNITWGSNPHTLINYLRNEHAAGRQLVIEDATRYLIDLDEFLHWVALIPGWPCEINCPGRMFSVHRIAQHYVLDKWSRERS